MNNFFSSIKELLLSISYDNITTAAEIGCGEGNLTQYINSLRIFSHIQASDFSSHIVDVAKKENASPNISYYVKNIYELDTQETSDVIISCEVLEHLQDVELGLEKLAAVTKKYCLVSVPREPVWRIMNLCRFKYVKDCGNTPGHINHWSVPSFKKLINNYFHIHAVKTPLPWIIILGRKR